MNIQTNRFTRGVLVVTGLLLISACASAPTAPEGADTARAKLTRLQSDAQLANLAPVEIQEAEKAVFAAEEPRRDTEYARHLVMVADHRVDIARARAQSRLYEDQRQALSEQSERVRLEARTIEADRARMDARAARSDADRAREEAQAARMGAEAARQDTALLRQQIAELNARETDRGLVVTLGDLLFATGKSELTGGAAPNLDKLAEFLREYPDRTVLIEGHTDSVGSESSNFLLSERRADSVKSYLVRQGIAAGRLSTAGLGQGSPVAGNDTATGRQQNRRVEVIISNVTSRARADQ